jgi:predicted RNase H-like nuclease (RuvC/YqgF family)
MLASHLPIIVGIDPGTTTAIAVLDTDGSLLSLMSKKNMSRAEISRHLSGLGRPVMVAADRRPAPAAVEKLAAVFSARLVVPDENLSRREKNHMAREFLEERPERPNQHERDALASALHAYNTIRPTMRRVEKRLRVLGLSDNPELERFVRTRVILNGDHVKRSIERFKAKRE